MVYFYSYHLFNKSIYIVRREKILITWILFFSQMQQLGNMKDNLDDLSDPEQFACLVSWCVIIFLKRPLPFVIKIQRNLCLKRKSIRAKGNNLSNQSGLSQIFNPCQARENMQSEPSAGKHAASAKRRKNTASAKRWKTCSRSQAPENMQPEPSAGKIQLVPSAGKHAVGAKRRKNTASAKRGKTCSQSQAPEKYS